ncbi:MAG TPA: DUF3343 domain-containing protein [Dehalococcoidales bacterium]|nr:DUF3343 domain-containing protein [Dehalococcoidales bacterium]
MKRWGVALFHTTSCVMQAEKAFLKAGLKIKLIPTPRQFSSDCGIAVRFEWVDLNKVEEILDFSGIEFDTIHSIDQRDNIRET